MGRDREAIDQYRKASEIEPKFGGNYSGMGDCYERLGMNEEAIAEHVKSMTLSGMPAEQIEELRQAYRASGMKGVWQKSLEQLLKRAEQSDVAPLAKAHAYARVGDKEQALRWLERSVQEREPPLLHINNSPNFEFLRSDPRFQALLRRMRLAP